MWRAWTEPDQLVRWWGKRGWTAQRETVELDLRPGGTFKVTTVNDEDGSEMTNEGIYSEVDPPERLAFDDAVVTFIDLGDGRTEMRFRTTIHADAALAERAAGGLKSAFERLENHLKETS